MATDPPAPAARGDVAAALRKAAVVWIGTGGDDMRAVWPLWDDGTLYVLHGGGEQSAPGLGHAPTVGVAVPAKGARELALRFPATVRTVPPGSPEWDRLVPLLLAKRLNLRDPAAAPRRWAEESVLAALTPLYGD